MMSIDWTITATTRTPSECTAFRPGPGRPRGSSRLLLWPRRLRAMGNPSHIFQMAEGGTVDRYCRSPGRLVAARPGAVGDDRTGLGPDSHRRRQSQDDCDPPRYLGPDRDQL